MKYTLKNPENLCVRGPDGETHTGGSQEWYADPWRKKAGCGPVAAANIIWYAARPEREKNNSEARAEPDGKQRFAALMDEMITHIVPTMRGVNTSAIFTDGISGYAAAHKLNFAPLALEVPAQAGKRPGPAEVGAFIANAIQDDMPVAFLNLSNGSLKNLDSWHWVTIFAFDGETMDADFCDQGKVFTVNINEWLDTTLLGGAFARIAAAR